MNGTSNADSNQARNGYALWNLLEKHGLNGQKATTSSSKKKSIVRVYVSSTLRDFFSEREILASKVFPSVRQWLATYGLKLVECDLRYGASSEATSQKAIETIFDELDRHRKETDDRPFFISLLGDSVGWTPPAGDLTEEMRNDIGWVQGASISLMEILRGAYWINNKNALFLVRDQTFMKDLPPEFHKDFIEEPGSFADSCIQETKSRLKQKFPHRFITYSCKFYMLNDQNTQGVRKLLLNSLEKFSDEATNFLKKSIAEFYELPDKIDKPISARPGAAEQSNDDVIQAQDNFLDNHNASPIYGRDDDIAKYINWVLMGGNNEQLQRLNHESVKKSRPNKHLLCVCAEAGVGKTCMAARLVKTIRDRDEFRVIFHFIEATADSSTPRKICSNLSRQALKICEESGEKKAAVDFTLTQIIESLRNLKKSVLFVIDGLNHAHHIDSWLPEIIYPPNVFVIVTTASDQHVFRVLAARGAFETQLDSLNVDAQKQCITQFFTERSKTVEESVLNALLSHTGSSNASWLQMALGELAMLRTQADLLKLVEKLPTGISQLADYILKRAMQENVNQLPNVNGNTNNTNNINNNSKVNSLLCLLAAARDGVFERDLPLLLGDNVNKRLVATALIDVLQLCREIRSITRLCDARLRITPGFLHSYVRKKHLIDFQHGAGWHKRLADFYGTSDYDAEVISRELPYHLFKANLREPLLQFFRCNPRCRNNPAERRSFLIDLLCPSSAAKHKIPAVLCTFCANATGKLSPTKTAASTCYLCGISTHQSEPSLMCDVHGYVYQMGGMQNCILCRNVAVQPVPMVICRLCHCSNTPAERCCEFVRDDEDLLYPKLWKDTSHKWLEEYADPLTKS